jgi:adenosylcobinamide-GDP ribazoletransferase
VLSGVAIAVLACGWWAGPFLAAAVVGAAIVAALSSRKIGGVTGDVLGATEQVVECMVLVVASGLAVHRHLWWT